MKRLIFILLFIGLNLPSFAQDSTELAARSYYNVASQASHHKMAWFTGHTQEETVQFQEYLQQNLHYVSDEQGTTLKNGVYTTKYTHPFVAGDNTEKPLPLYVLYHFKSDLKTISKVQIVGSWADVVNILVLYWEKPLKPTHNPKNLLHLTSFGDNINFKATSSGFAMIEITENHAFTQISKPKVQF